uniref:FitA-like ribbon-helix-helix domain-containing protein n=1 Tax=Castellaniella defragrans TaxID=75697 RepID=UPI003341493A
MANINVRNLPDEVYRAIRVQAAQHGRSTAAQIRHILQEEVMPKGRVKPGDLMLSITRRVGGLTDAEAERINNLRDKTPAEPMEFE